MNPSPTLLIGASIPRSGHHFLERMLRHYFGRCLHYCEFYTPSWCCRQIPCAKRGAFEIIYQKSHDFDLTLDAAIAGATYVVQYRHPTPNLASGWELTLSDPVGATPADYRTSRDNFAWWLARRAVHVRRFHDKWLLRGPVGAVHIPYEALCEDPARMVAMVIRAAAGTVDEGRLAAVVEVSRSVSSGTGQPYRPRRFDAAALPCPQLAAAYEAHVLRRCPAFGYAPMLDGGYEASYEGSLLQGLILAEDPEEPVPAGFTDRAAAIEALAGRHPEIRLRHARALIEARQPAAATAILEEVLTERPAFIPGWMPLFRAWRAARQTPKASMVTAEVMLRVMHDSAVVTSLAGFWRDQGRVVDAAAVMYAVVGLHPRRARPRAMLATILERMGRLPEAAAEARAAIALDPANAPALAVLERLRPGGGAPAAG